MSEGMESVLFTKKGRYAVSTHKKTLGTPKKIDKESPVMRPKLLWLDNSVTCL